jgi:hypothetical protein
MTHDTYPPKPLSPEALRAYMRGLREAHAAAGEHAAPGAWRAFTATPAPVVYAHTGPTYTPANGWGWPAAR